jgi:hypothetical protein
MADALLKMSIWTEKTLSRKSCSRKYPTSRLPELRLLHAPICIDELGLAAKAI